MRLCEHYSLLVSTSVSFHCKAVFYFYSIDKARKVSFLGGGRGGGVLICIELSLKFFRAMFLIASQSDPSCLIRAS